MKRKSKILLSITLLCAIAFILVAKMYLDHIDCSSFRLKTQRKLVEHVQSAPKSGAVRSRWKESPEDAAMLLESFREKDLFKRNKLQQSLRERLLGRRQHHISDQQPVQQQQQQQKDLTRNRDAVIPAAKLATFVRRPSEFRSKLSPNMTLGEIVRDSNIVCELHLFALGNCLEGEEAGNCIQRVGAKNLETVLPARCRESPYFQQLVNRKGAAPLDPEVWTKLRRTQVYEEQVFSTRMPRPQYVPPAKRPRHAYKTGPRVCQSSWSKISGCAMHPIGFAVPEMAIATRASRVKLFDFLPFLPRWYPMLAGLGYSLGIHEEEFSRILHRHSFFAFTHRRGGWDVLRHYESFTQGTLPYFPDILQCDKFCMTAFPKDFAAKVLSLPGVSHIGHVKAAADGVSSRYIVKEPGVEYNNPKLPHVLNFRAQGDINWEKFNTTAYFELADEMLEYARAYSTTKSLATYMLQVVGIEEPRNVLVIMGPTYQYFVESIVHGLYDLGINYTTVLTQSSGSSDGSEVVDELNHRVTQRIEADSPITEGELEEKREAFRAMHGQLYTFGLRRLDPNPALSASRTKERILAHEYDLVIYTWTAHPGGDSKGEFLKDRPLWEEVSTAYLPAEIVFIDSTDDVYFDPTPVLAEMCGKGTIFRRSLHDKEC
jgi:hypothetical protein